MPCLDGNSGGKCKIFSAKLRLFRRVFPAQGQRDKRRPTGSAIRGKRRRNSPLRSGRGGLTLGLCLGGLTVISFCWPYALTG